MRDAEEEVDMYTVFPTGTTIYNPEKCYDGYTLYLSKTLGVGAVLVDMNGTENT